MLIENKGFISVNSNLDSTFTENIWDVGNLRHFSQLVEYKQTGSEYRIVAYSFKVHSDQTIGYCSNVGNIA